MNNISQVNASPIGRTAQVSDLKAEVVEIRKPFRARRGDDKVEVSDAARFLAKLNAMPEVRTDLVERVRAQIADGTYDSDEKFDLALDGLIEEALGEDTL